MLSLKLSNFWDSDTTNCKVVRNVIRPVITIKTVIYVPTPFPTKDTSTTLVYQKTRVTPPRTLSIEYQYLEFFMNLPYFDHA